MGIFLFSKKDALYLRQGGHIREAINPEHDRFAGSGDPGLADCLRLSAGIDDLGDIVDADRPSFDEALHVTLCDDALASLDVDAEHTLGVLHAADVFKGGDVVMHCGSHHIVIDGRDNILPPCSVKVIISYLLCIYSVYFAQSILALRASPTTCSRSYRGLTLRRLTGACNRSAPATPSLCSVAAFAALVLVVLII